MGHTYQSCQNVVQQVRGGARYSEFLISYQVISAVGLGTDF